jgi:hypothetical protein
MEAVIPDHDRVSELGLPALMSDTAAIRARLATEMARLPKLAP